MESARVAGHCGTTIPTGPSARPLPIPIVVEMAIFSIPTKVARNSAVNTTGVRVHLSKDVDVWLLLELRNLIKLHNKISL